MPVLKCKEKEECKGIAFLKVFVFTFIKERVGFWTVKKPKVLFFRVFVVKNSPGSLSLMQPGLQFEAHF